VKHLWALIIKTIMVFAVLYVIQNWINAYPVGPTFALSLLLVGLSYLIGDLAILPMTNNIVASLADVGLNTLVIWLVGPFLMDQFVPFSTALSASVIIGIGEWFFHQYMAKSVLSNQERETST
jgi:hypothetical protein